MNCKCEQAPFPQTPCPLGILATFPQPHPVKGMSLACICWQSWGLEHPGLETPRTRVLDLSSASSQSLAHLHLPRVVHCI